VLTDTKKKVLKSKIIRNKNIYLILIIFVNIISIEAQEQITSFHIKPGDKSSNPSKFKHFNNRIYFSAYTEVYGRELYVSNGNKNNAVILKDIALGKKSAISYPSFVTLNSTLFFIANDGLSKGELWKSDGTSNGTIKVTNFLDYAIIGLTKVDNFIFFITKPDSGLWKLWKSDGTALGTTVVKEIPASDISYQGQLNGLFIFTVNTPNTNDSRVWRSDGTSSGTYPLMPDSGGNGAGITQGNGVFHGGTSYFTQYIEFNNELYFVIRNSSIFGTNSVGIMKTDGTVENTVAVKAVHNGFNMGGYSGLINYADVISLNNKLYFSFYQNDFKRLFIWETDGSVNNGNLIYDKVNPTYFVPSNLSTNNNSLIFCTGSTSGVTSLVELNIDTLLITELKELANGIPEPSYFHSRKSISNIYKIAPDKSFISLPYDRLSSSIVKGWITDFTEKTTTNYSNLDGIRSIYLFNDQLYFTKDSDLFGYELWKSDGTQENTFLIENINKSKYGINTTMKLSSFNNLLIFNAFDSEFGEELWMYNNNTSNLSLLKDINIGTFDSSPRNIIPYKNNLLFRANDNINGFELWKTDGTKLGTSLIKNINEKSTSSYPSLLTEHKNSLYFMAKPDTEYFLYRKDEGDPIPIKGLGFDFSGQYNYSNQIVSSGNYIYFSAGMGHQELWRSDGTEIGTIFLKKFNELGKIVDVDGHVFFPASSTETPSEIELYKSNGTIAGTKLIKNIEVGFSSYPANLTLNKGILYFTAKTSTEGRELWKTDGTEEGTKLITDINLGVNSSINDPYHIAFPKHNPFPIIKNEMYFSADNGISGEELWKSDGTSIGTSMVLDINNGFNSSNPKEMAVIDDLLYFQALDSDHGAELWKSDGTEHGTILASDVFPGAESSSPSSIMNIDENLFFIAKTVHDGRQIWRIQDEITLSISEVSGNELITIYPNPSYDFVNIKTNNHIDKIKIYDLNGSLIKSISSISDNCFNIEELSSGVYLISYEIEDRISYKKLIKK